VATSRAERTTDAVDQFGTCTSDAAYLDMAVVVPALKPSQPARANWLAAALGPLRGPVEYGVMA
jgi:hypothetical protein